MTTSTQLDRNALLVSLSVTRWTGRKTDKRASDALTESSNARTNTARVSKDLIPRAPIQAINQAYDAAFRTLKHMTLPWSDDGRRLIPASVVMSFTSQMQAHEKTFWGLVADLQTQYAELRAQAEEDLGDLFNADDYPPAASIPTRFKFAYGLEPVPSSGDMRVELPDSVLASVSAGLQKDIDERLRAATSDVYSRVHAALSRMVTVLNADKPRIFDSLTGDMHALVAVLPDLNLTNDPKLTSLAQKLDAQFHAVTASDLRESEGLRAIKAQAAQSVLDDMAGLL